MSYLRNFNTTLSYTEQETITHFNRFQIFMILQDLEAFGNSWRQG